MSRDVLFQMWEPFRQSLIAGHLFYVEQARKRLLSQFDDIDAEADRAAADWLQNNSHRFDPDRHYAGVFEERAICAAGCCTNDVCKYLLAPTFAQPIVGLNKGASSPMSSESP